MPIHWFWILALLVVVLIIFGPGRLPELGGAVGKAMREFRKATSEITSEITSEMTNATQAKQEQPPSTTTPTDSATKGSASETNSTKS